ncbi:MAG: RrF2 family transcriptional regulator [Planctomycetota bacterium]|jgi:Rrf2 family protein
MQLTRGCEYAIRGLVYLAMQEQEEPVLLADIAKSIEAPTNYLSNIFQILTRLGLVSSHRGAKRGYTLSRSPAEINLREVVEGMEGPISISSCNLDKGWCEHEESCSMFQVWEEIQENITAKLEKTTLSQLTGSCFVEGAS